MSPVDDRSSLNQRGAEERAQRRTELIARAIAKIRQAVATVAEAVRTFGPGEGYPGGQVLIALSRSLQQLADSMELEGVNLCLDRLVEPRRPVSTLPASRKPTRTRKRK